MQKIIMLRDISIDIAKCIGIILVFVGHCKIDYDSNLFIWIYSFHMPLFFILSGLTFTPPELQCKSLYNKFLMLILAYVFFSIVNVFILSEILGETEYAMLSILINGWGKNPLWFIPILLSIELLITMINNGSGFLKAASIAILSSLLLFKVITNARLPYCISEIPWFFICFSVGFYCKSLYSKINASYPMAIFLFFAHLVVLFFLILPYNQDYRNTDNDLFSYLFRIIIGLLGSIDVIVISKILSRYPFAKYLGWLGANTMVVYAIHWPLIRWCSEYDDSILSMAVILLLSIVLIFPYNRYILPVFINLRNNYKG